MKVDAGLSYLDDNFTLQSSNTFANNFWQAYARLRRALGPHVGRASVPSSIYQRHDRHLGLHSRVRRRGALPPALLVYSPYDLYGLPRRVSAIRRRKTYPGLQLRLLRNRVTPARSTSRSIRAASRTSPRRPGRCSSARISTTETRRQAVPLDAPACATRTRTSPRRGVGRVPTSLTHEHRRSDAADHDVLGHRSRSRPRATTPTCCRAST